MMNYSLKESEKDFEVPCHELLKRLGGKLKDFLASNCVSDVLQAAVV